MVWNKSAELFDVVGTPLDAPRELCARVQSILSGRWPTGVDHALVERAFLDVTRAFFGEYPGLLACDTRYHDLRHALEAALVIARLLDGYEKMRMPGDAALRGEDAAVGIMLALFHDIGMLRNSTEARLHGAQLMPGHETRSVEFARAYLCRGSLASRAGDAELIMITRLGVPSHGSGSGAPQRRVLAQALSAADLLSQTADRCYLEKCRDYLFRELAIAGLDRSIDERGVTVFFADANDLLRKTPAFVEHHVTGPACHARDWLRGHFEGANPYQESIERNMRFLGELIGDNDFSQLRRRPVAFAPI